MNLTKNIRNTAVRVLQNEAEAISKIAELIDQDFIDCVEHILHTPGRVVITGIGKSAIIANKIVATLNSTGTPSIFMHAADAIHGDLGMIQSNDVVICISKSGNTPEIKILVPLLKKMGSKLVAMVSNTNSYLAEQADFVLNATIGEEACPHNLAPTTSTTAHLAMGDALAVCLLEAKGFTSEDFAKYHPGGSLGKQLYLKVGDILSKGQVPKVNENAGLTEVIIEISGKRLGATAVVDHLDKVKGIITDGDLRRTLEKTLDLQQFTAKDVMTEKPKTISVDEYAIRALNMMKNYNITQLVVMDGENIAGFVHIHDLMKEGIV